MKLASQPNAGGPTLGRATTKPAELSGMRMFVNLATRPAKKMSQPGTDAGLLKVELLDGDGQPIAGFTQDDCRPLSGDGPDLPVSWKGGEAAPRAARQARFILKRAFLYGFEFRKS